MIREIIELGNPILRTKARTFRDFKSSSHSTQCLITDLAETMREGRGFGIAAPQIGVSQRMVIVSSRPNAGHPHAPLVGPTVMIDPRLEWASSVFETDWEGCLSVPGIRALVSRSTHVRVKYTDPLTTTDIMVEYRDLAARVWQHENDHLDGVIFLDLVDPRDIVTYKEYCKLVNIPPAPGAVSQMSGLRVPAATEYCGK